LGTAGINAAHTLPFGIVYYQRGTVQAGSPKSVNLNTVKPRNSLSGSHEVEDHIAILPGGRCTKAAMRWIVGGKAIEKHPASTSKICLIGADVRQLVT